MTPGKPTAKWRVIGSRNACRRDSNFTRAVLSREFWRRIGCLKPDGCLKGMMARVAMLRFSTDACPSTGPIATAPPSGQGIALHVIR